MAAGDNRVAQKNTFGGFRHASFYSGAVVPNLTSCPAGAFAVGSDVMLQSGPGRLDIVLANSAVQSGLGVTFYDAAAPVSGGPIPASGHRICGVIPPVNNSVAAFVGSGYPDPAALQPGIPIQVSLIFTSGLCVNLRSGQPGFTANWTSEDLR